MSILDSALEYAENGLSVIPIVPGQKKPLIKWEEYQSRIARTEEIESWFDQWPNANIGIVTGDISGIGVVDLDSQEAIAWAESSLPKTNIIQETGRGLQWIYKRNGQPVPQGSDMVSGVPGIDCRGDGGYIVAAPSVHPTGAIYKLNILYGDWSELPPFPYDFFKTKEEKKKTPVSIAPVCEGSRDDSLTRVAGKYFANGMDYQEVLAMCMGVNLTYNPPLSQKDVERIVHSIEKSENTKCVDIRGQRGQACTPGTLSGHPMDSVDEEQGQDYGKSWTIGGAIREFIEEQSGIFTNFDIDKELSLTTRNEKKARYESLRRLQNEGKIKKLEGKPGTWRILNHLLERVDFSNSEGIPVSLGFPLDIGELAQVYPGNIILIAGTSNAGKTGFLMQTCVDTIKRKKEKNQKKERESKSTSVLNQMINNGVRYLNSEMGPDEIIEWEKSLNYPLHEEVDFVNRSIDFQDALIPDGINIIDYLEVYEEFYKIGADIAAIYDNLTTGIAIIAIQKKPGAEFGIGGQFSAWKARLVINLEKTETCVRVAKLVKLKKPVDRDDNHEGKQADYVVSSTGGFRKLTGWRYMTDKERKSQNNIYVRDGVKLPRKKEDVYQFDIMLVDGSYAKVTNATVKQWQKNMPGVNVPAELRRIQENSKIKPFLKKDGWFHQLAAILKGKEKNHA